MGSYSSKQDSEYSDLLISRCPRRNRVIKNIVLKEEGKQKNIVEKKDRINLNNKHKLYESEIEKLEDYDSKFEVVKSKKPKQNLSSLQLVLKAENSSEPEYLKQNSKFQKNETDEAYTNKKKKQKQHKQDKEDYKLISDILHTIEDLEATFIEEKKYERKLFATIAAQIQELQQFSLSLHKEKGQNKRLKELLNFCENDFETNMEKQSSPKHDKRDSLPNRSLSENFDRQLVTAGSNLSLSPLLLQQKIDELSTSLSRCKAELCIRNKQFILSQCEQEELQSKCDELAEKLQVSNETINSLNHEIENLKREKKILKKSTKPYLKNKLKSSIGSEISPNMLETKVPINKDKAE